MWCIPDTDSLKLRAGFDKSVIDNYNKECIEKIKIVSERFNINIEKFSPTDVKGIKHTIGLFDNDGDYLKFKTLGAKKYAYITKMPLDKAKKKDIYKIIRTKGDTAYCLGITVSGVPKKGAKAMKDLSDFRNDFIFTHEFTGKNLISYNDDMIPFEITDYLGNKYLNLEKYGACIVPTTYELGMSQDYMELVIDRSSHKAIFKE